MSPDLALARRVVVYGVVPPLLMCLTTGWWALDQAALAVRLVQDHRRAHRGS